VRRLIPQSESREDRLRGLALGLLTTVLNLPPAPHLCNAHTLCLTGVNQRNLEEGLTVRRSDSMLRQSVAVNALTTR
jgi:hypothetical protein